MHSFDYRFTLSLDNLGKTTKKKGRKRFLLAVSVNVFCMCGFFGFFIQIYC